MNKEDEMSNTFVAEVGQKSAIFDSENNGNVENLNETSAFPDVKIDPPKSMPSTLESEKTNNTEKEENEEEEFLEAKKKKKSKKYKKRNPFITFLLVVICLALGAGASYYYFEVYNKTENNEISKTDVNKNSNKEIKEEQIEEIEPTSTFAKRLIERYDGSFTSSSDLGNYQALYAKDKITPNDFDANYIQILGIANVRAPFYFAKEELDTSLNELFGENKFKASEKDITFGDCKEYKYNSGYYSYKQADECGGTSSMSMKRKIVKAEKNNNKLYINVAIEITSDGNVYKAYDITNNKGVDQLVDYTYETFDIEKDYAKLNQYKYTFDFDKNNNNYYLESIELVK